MILCAIVNANKCFLVFTITQIKVCVNCKRKSPPGEGGLIHRIAEGIGKNMQSGAAGY